MNYVIIEYSNYLIFISLALYLISSTWVLFANNPRKIRGVYIRQCIYMLMVHTVGMSTLFFVNDDPKYIYLYLAQVICSFVINRMCCLLYEKCNRLLLNHMNFLLTFSYIILSRLSFNKGVRQLILVAASAFLFLIVPLVIRSFKSLHKFTAAIGVAGIILIILVLAIGSTVNGSKLAFTIGGFSFQASEYVKILYCLFVAGLLHQNKKLPRVISTFLVSCVFIGLLALSRDLGSALIFYVALISVIFLATGNIFYPIIGYLGGVLAAVMGYRLFPHVRVRVAAFIDPFEDINKAGYQLSQSLFGIGTGNWFGLGLGRGKPNTIPYVDQDFAFSAICEEMGAVTGILLILIYLVIFIAIIRMSLKASNEYYKLTGIGLGTIFGMQVILAIGGGTRFIPLTGLTLPLISSGGSSLMSMMLMFGVLQGISISSNKNSKVGDLGNHKDYYYSSEEYYDDSIYDEEYYDEPSYDENYDENYYGNDYSDEYDDYGNDYTDDEYYSDDEEYYEDEYKDNKSSSNTLFSRIFTWGDKLCFAVTIAVNVIIFGLMIFNLSKFLVKDREKILNNSFNNKRLEVLASENYRGSIYANDGTLLAETIIDSNGNEVRIYPEGNLYAHSVGYSTFGRSGIEAQMNVSLLTSDIGINDRIANDMAGRKNPGNNVYTSLDPVLQKAASDALGLYRGSVIVQEAKTGRILCMVSKPDFDPNKIASEWESISGDKLNSPLMNRATQGLYPPGSTFKIITALEYMRQYPDNYKNYYFTCNGRFTLGEDKINCYHKMTHGGVDFVTSFAKSCNSSFANMGSKLDRNKWADTLDDLLFNEHLPVDFEYKPSRISMRQDMSNEEIIQSAIGQSETLMTPLHLNMITAAIANDGIMMKPYMVDYVKNADGKVIKKYKPSEYGRVISKEESEQLKLMMIEVVEHGTATKLSGQGYTAAGKTGSAEYGDVKGQSHAWFTGFAPSDNPEIIVTVIIEGGGSGGDYSAPVARRIFSAYFEQ